jgi:hypothetical protein
MGRGRRRASLGALLRRLPVSVLIAVTVWYVGREVYYPSLCWATEKVARIYEWPRAAQLTRDGDNVLMGRIDLRADSGTLALSLTQVTFNFVPFLALAMALPGRWGRTRVTRLASALAIMFLCHLLTVLWQLKCFYAFSLGPWSQVNYSDMARSIYGGLRYFFDIPVTFALPLVLWAGAYFDEVLELLDLVPGSKT